MNLRFIRGIENSYASMYTTGRLAGLRRCYRDVVGHLTAESMRLRHLGIDAIILLPSQWIYICFMICLH